MDSTPRCTLLGLLLLLLRRLLRSLLCSFLLRLHRSCPSSESPESSPGVVNVEIFSIFYKRIFPLTPIEIFDRYFFDTDERGARPEWTSLSPAHS
jgi:hypothetical protein